MRISAPASRRGVGHRTGQRAGSAFDGHAAAARRRIDGRVQEQRRAGARRPGSLGYAEDSAGGDSGLQKIAREPLGDEIGGGHRHPSEEPERVGASERAKPAAGLQQLPQLARRRTVERRRRRLENLAEKCAQPLEHAAELRILRGIRFREDADGLGRSRDVGRKGQRAAVRRERHEPRVRRDELHTPGRKPHVANDRWPQRADGVRERRTAEARRDLFGDGAAANHRPPLEHERLQPGLGQVEGGGEAVDAGADDDDGQSESGVRSQESESGWSRVLRTLPASGDFLD